MYVAATTSGEWITVDADDGHHVVLRITDNEGKGPQLGLFRINKANAQDLIRAVEEKIHG